MSDSKEKNTKLDLGLSEILAKASSASNENKEELKVKEQVEVRKEEEKKEEEITNFFIPEKALVVFKELIVEENWSKLLSESEVFLETEKEQYPLIKIWWVYAALKSSSLPVALLVPSLDSGLSLLSEEMTDKSFVDETVIIAKKAIKYSASLLEKDSDSEFISALNIHLKNISEDDELENSKVDIEELAEDFPSESELEFEDEPEVEISYTDKNLSEKSSFSSLVLATLLGSLLTGGVLFYFFNISGVENLENYKVREDFSTKLVYNSRKESKKREVTEGLDDKEEYSFISKEPKELAQILTSLNEIEKTQAVEKEKVLVKEKKEESPKLVKTSLNLESPLEPEEVKSIIEEFSKEPDVEIQQEGLARSIPLKPVIMASSSKAKTKEKLKARKPKRERTVALKQERLRVTRSALVYSRPNVSSLVLTELSIGSEVLVSENMGGWLKISSSHDRVGYIKSTVVDGIN